MSLTKEIDAPMQHPFFSHGCFHKYINLCELIDDLTITTITSVCKFINTKFTVEYIAKYIHISIDKVQYAFCSKGRTVRICKGVAFPEKIPSGQFENQTTLWVHTNSKKKPINIKIFRNGSMQMTGCQSIFDCINTISIVTDAINNIPPIHKLVDGKYKKIHMVEDSDHNGIHLIPNNDTQFKIELINVKFELEFGINRKNLFTCLNKDNVQCKFNPDTHASMDITFKPNNPNPIGCTTKSSKVRKNMSIFVFRAGNVIITSSKNRDDIISAYRFIIAKLAKYYVHIVSHTKINDKFDDICTDMGLLDIQ